MARIEMPSTATSTGSALYVQVHVPPEGREAPGGLNSGMGAEPATHEKIPPPQSTMRLLWGSEHRVRERFENCGSSARINENGKTDSK